MRAYIALISFVMLSALAPSVTHADQRRDYMLTGLGAGDRLMLDYMGTGGALTFEHRRNFLGRVNDYAFSASTLLTYPLGQLSLGASLRFLFFELGMNVGYRAVWRNLSFEPGMDGAYCKDCDRPARRARDPILGGGPDSDHFPFFEGRIQLYAPFNDYFVLTSLFATRYEGLRPRSYDWIFTNIHDPGWMTRWEVLAFLKHRRWGGIGPYVQLQWVPQDGRHVTEFAYGFNAMTRLGLLARNDLVFLTFLMRPNDGNYGQHSYFAPLRALIVYRLTINL
ncbi:MAG: hypothetical protein ABW321_26010 [Polyangiales bacterium]